MAYKTILVYIDSNKRCATRVEVAIRLALLHDAHLVALYAQDSLVLPRYLMPVGPEIIEAQEKSRAVEMACAEGNFTKQSATLGLNNAEWRTTPDNPVDALSKYARYVDLVIIGQHDPAAHAIVDENIPARLVSEIGRPVLILPYVGSFPTLGKRILVAWNASREASRAINDALPLLRSAAKVSVMEISPGRGEQVSEPDANILPYLVRHGVHAEVTSSFSADIDVGNELLSRASDLSADLLVMGGYSHSRMREWVLGGVTRTLLESMTIPVLMSH